MTFAYMLLAAALTVVLLVEASDRYNGNLLVVAAALIGLGTFMFGILGHGHNVDYHAEDEPVCEEVARAGR